MKQDDWIYGPSLALLTDFYQLTMVYGYWKAGMAERKAVFHLNFRKWPFQGGFAIAAGLGTAIEFLQRLRFIESDLAYLEQLAVFERKFLDFLADFSFACDVDAMVEGTAAFPYEPLLRVKGPLWQAQLLESPLLNLVNFQTLIATKAARICLAAHPDPVIEFGMRRAQGADGAISASRAAFIGGCEGTSNVLAGKLFGIPVRGTHAHSWVMAFQEEREAFETFAKIWPSNCILLVDTYDSLKGTLTAVQVAKSLKAQGVDLAGVRLDSGDLARLSIEIRKILDREGLTRAEIMASNELDEHLIRDLKQQGARIGVWGVGTNLVTGKEQPALDGVYKLAAIQDSRGQWQPRIKLSEQTAKTTNPGILQVRRFFDGRYYLGDAIYDELTGIHEPCTAVSLSDPSDEAVYGGQMEREDLLIPIFREGKTVYSSPPLQEIRQTAQRELSRLPDAMKRFLNPQLYRTGLEKALYQKKLKMIHALRS